MTRIEQVELETDLEEIQTAIDEYTAVLVRLTNEHRAAAILLDALTLAANHAGRICYQLKAAKETEG